MRNSPISCEQFLVDLEWLVKSPSLVSSQSGDTFSLFEFVGGNEGFQDAFPPESIEAYLERYPIAFRVGIYFESLLHFYLLHHPFVEDVVRGIRLFDNRRTIGELDFLFSDPNGNRCHLETAVKFYLRLPSNLPGESRWVGPNASDNFDKKWARLTEHQLPLSGRLEQEVVKRFLLLRGRLFWHIAEPTRERKHLYPRINEHCLAGQWLYASEYSWLMDAPFSRPREIDGKKVVVDCWEVKFQLQQKPFWLSPAQADGVEPTLMDAKSLCNTIQNHFIDSTRPLLVSVLATRDAVAAHRSHANSLEMQRGIDWIEIDRIFIVHDRWPQA